MAGRPTTLTASISDEICRALRVGAALRIAADSLGIPVKTALGWLALGEEARACEQARCSDAHHGPRGGELTYAAFAEEMQRAKGQAGLRAAASMSARFQDDPHFAERWLAKQYPDDFGARAGMPDQGAQPVGPPLVIRVVSQPAAVDASTPPPAPTIDNATVGRADAEFSFGHGRNSIRPLRCRQQEQKA